MSKSKLNKIYAEEGLTETFWSEVRKVAFGFIYSKAKEDAEDLSMDTVLRVLQNIGTFDSSRSSINTFVKLTAESVLNRHLSEKYANPKVISLDTEYMTVGEDGLGAELWESFEEDKELRDLLLQGYSLREIEEVLGISREAVRWRMNKVRKAYLADMEE